MKKRRAWHFVHRTVFFVCVILICINGANADVLVMEGFAYGDGDLVSQENWSAHSGAGNNPVQVSDGMVTLVQGSGSREDANIAFTPIIAGQTYYAGFDFTVIADGPLTDTDYFGHFMETSTDFEARVFVGEIDGGDYQVGLSGNGGAPDSSFGVPLQLGTIHRAVVSYEFDTGNVELWIDAIHESDASIMAVADANEPKNAFGLRQTNFNNPDPTIKLDNLFIDAEFRRVVPEPVALVWFVLMGAPLGWRRR